MVELFGLVLLGLGTWSTGMMIYWSVIDRKKDDDDLQF
jgi:hypothetical protein